jgi:saccharopine dehydrogenase-like NADP-dependent oxidoreductase
MKILLLGGAGEMGKSLLHDLSSSLKCELIIGDYRLEEAKNVAEKYGATERFVDANDLSSLTKAMKDADIAVNCIGPHYRYAVRIAKAAIEAGVNYLDICDDYQPTIGILELGKEAASQELSLLTGFGWTPGLSNVLARKGADEVGKVKEINIAWTGDCNVQGQAVVEHMLTIITGKVPSFRNGKLVMVPAGKGGVLVEFPEPIGYQKVCDLGHPEPVTIPRFIPSDTVTLKGALVPRWAYKWLRFLARVGATKTPERRRKLSKRILSISNSSLIKHFTRKTTLSTLRVEVSGEERKVYSTIDTMARLTGIPASVGTIMLARGDVKEYGVLPPEACIQPDIFLREVAERGIKISEL